MGATLASAIVRSLSAFTAELLGARYRNGPHFEQPRVFFNRVSVGHRGEMIDQQPGPPRVTPIVLGNHPVSRVPRNVPKESDSCHFLEPQQDMVLQQ